jgi:hypothetical protein
VGLATAGGLVEIAAGVLGTAATWVASTGSRAAGRGADSALGRDLREAGPCFGGGGAALRCVRARCFVAVRRRAVCGGLR